MDDNRKPYERPTIRRVLLEVSESVLATCSRSPGNIPKIGTAVCSVTQCFTP